MNLEAAIDREVRPQIAILDLGSQYTQLIAKRTEHAGVKTVIVPGEITREELAKLMDEYGIRGLILSGGPASVYDENAPNFDHSILEMDVPILGICYGMQLMAYHEEGGRVERRISKESEGRQDGVLELILNDAGAQSDFFRGVYEKSKALFTHGDSVTEIPHQYEVLAMSEHGNIAAMAASRTITDGDGIERRITKIGTQFHPEVNDTKFGNAMLRNFVHDICRCDNNYTIEDKIEESIQYLAKKIGDKKAFVLASGGVDSTVTLKLLLIAAERGLIKKEQIYAVHIDNGFMREGESDVIAERLEGMGVLQENFLYLKGEDIFCDAVTEIPIAWDETNRNVLQSYPSKPLSQTIDPEEKRMIIGDTFFRTAIQQMYNFGLDPSKDFLVQGTLFTDSVESGKTGKGKKGHIKTHHNEAPYRFILEDLFGDQILEPNRWAFKDDIRKVAALLGLPEEIVKRHPFPGPGDAIRIICGDIPYKHERYREVQETIQEKVEAETGGLFRYFTLPTRSVGVQGDDRSYKAMGIVYRDDLDETIKEGHTSTSFIYLKEILVPHITGAVSDESGINRVLYLLDKKGRKEITQEDIDRVTPLFLTKEAKAISRYIHKIVEDLMEKEYECDDGQRRKMYDLVSQLPVALTYNALGGEGTYTVILAGLHTQDFMTGQAIVPKINNVPIEFYQDVTKALMKHDKIGAVAVGITGKPPATTELE